MESEVKFHSRYPGNTKVCILCFCILTHRGPYYLICSSLPKKREIIKTNLECWCLLYQPNYRFNNGTIDMNKYEMYLICVLLNVRHYFWIQGILESIFIQEVDIVWTEEISNSANKYATRSFDDFLKLVHGDRTWSLISKVIGQGKKVHFFNCGYLYSDNCNMTC